MENSPFIVEFATKPVHLGGFPLPFLITKGYHDWLIVKFHPAPSRHTWGTAAGATGCEFATLSSPEHEVKKRTIPRSWLKIETVASPSLPGMSLDPPENHPKQLGFPTIRERGRSRYRKASQLKSHFGIHTTHSPFCGVNHYSGSFLDHHRKRVRWKTTTNRKPPSQFWAQPLVPSFCIWVSCALPEHWFPMASETHPSEHGEQNTSRRGQFEPPS